MTDTQREKKINFPYLMEKKIYRLNQQTKKRYSYLTLFFTLKNILNRITCDKKVLTKTKNISFLCIFIRKYTCFKI